VSLRVLHLVGSAQSPLLDDLSRLYARDCLQTLADPDRHIPVLAHVGPDRRWRFPAGLSDAELDDAPALELPEAVARIAALAVDVALPQMFCLPGMTHYRALLELLGIPYLGNRPAVMALGAHKARARAVVAAAGVAVPEGEVVPAGESPRLAPPAVVKPIAGDNSEGVSLVRAAGEYPAALRAAGADDGEVLVERYVEPGREVRCGLLERDGELIGLPLEEYAVDPAAKPIRDAGDKLRRDGRGELGLVAKDAAHAWILDGRDPACEPVWAAARRAHRALGCRHYSLFDFRLDPAGRPWFLEAGLYCSFARQSVVATMARAAGIDTPQLFEIVLGEACPAGAFAPTPWRP
jgi:D-alanine-D-alanine ligase